MQEATLFDAVELFDVVELIVNLPQHGLSAGMHGTVLEVHGDGEAFEIEFSDEQGRTVNFLALPPEQFIVVWRAQVQEWVSLAERIAALIARLPASAGAEVLDFARFLSARSHPQTNVQTAHVSLAEAPIEYQA